MLDALSFTALSALSPFACLQTTFRVLILPKLLFWKVVAAILTWLIGYAVWLCLPHAGVWPETSCKTVLHLQVIVATFHPAEMHFVSCSGSWVNAFLWGHFLCKRKLGYVYKWLLPTDDTAVIWDDIKDSDVRLGFLLFHDKEVA